MYGVSKGKKRQREQSRLRGTGNTGTERAVHTQGSGRASLLRGTGAEVQGGEGTQGSSAGGDRGPGSGKSRKAVSGKRAWLHRLETEVIGLPGFPTPDPRLPPLPQSCHLGSVTLTHPAHSWSDSDFKNRIYRFNTSKIWAGIYPAASKNGQSQAH